MSWVLESTIPFQEAELFSYMLYDVSVATQGSTLLWKLLWKKYGNGHTMTYIEGCLNILGVWTPTKCSVRVEWQKLMRIQRCQRFYLLTLDSFACFTCCQEFFPPISVSSTWLFTSCLPVTDVCHCHGKWVRLFRLHHDLISFVSPCYYLYSWLDCKITWTKNKFKYR